MGPNKYPLYKVYMGLIIKGPPSQEYQDVPYDCFFGSFLYFLPRQIDSNKNPNQNHPAKILQNNSPFGIPGATSTSS